jgi:hypothetical protein
MSAKTLTVDQTPSHASNASFGAITRSHIGFGRTALVLRYVRIVRLVEHIRIVAVEKRIPAVIPVESTTAPRINDLSYFSTFPKI